MIRELWSAFLSIAGFVLTATMYNPRNWAVTEDERNDARKRFAHVR
jgi:hypothetical protein